MKKKSVIGIIILLIGTFIMFITAPFIQVLSLSSLLPTVIGFIIAIVGLSILLTSE